MDEFALTARGRKQLERTLHRTCDARVYRRTLAILEVGRGESVADVARMLGVSRQSVYNWLAEFDSSQRPECLVDDPRSGRPSLWTEQRQAWLNDLMRVRPEARILREYLDGATPARGVVSLHRRNGLRGHHSPSAEATRIRLEANSIRAPVRPGAREKNAEFAGK